MTVYVYETLISGDSAFEKVTRKIPKTFVVKKK